MSKLVYQCDFCVSTRKTIEEIEKHEKDCYLNPLKFYLCKNFTRYRADEVDDTCLKTGNICTEICEDWGQ